MDKNWLSQADFHAGISGFYGTRTALELFQEADCVIGVGASLNRYTTEHGYLYPNAHYVQLDVRPHVLFEGAKSADCYVSSAARLGFEPLDAVLPSRSFTSKASRTPEAT